MTKVHFVKKPVTPEDIDMIALFPMADCDLKAVNRFGDGEIIKQEIKAERNYLLLKKYWALCEAVAQNKKIYSDLEQINTKALVDEYLKIKTGLIKSRIVFPSRCPHCRGELDTVHIVTGSIAYSNMDNDKFSDWFNEALDIMAWMLGVTSQELNENWQEYEGAIE